MSSWVATLDALMRERGRDLYGYAFALTESRDAAEALVKDSLHSTFRRGAGPSTVDDADAQVRAAMRADERARAATSGEASAQFKESVAAGIASLGSRDTTDMIGPATRRAQKHRRTVALGWSAAALATVGAVALAATLLTGDPEPEPSASGVVVPAGTIDATYLIGESSNKDRSSGYTGPAGLRCEAGDENPHLDPSSDSVLAVECKSVWLSSELVITLAGDITADPAAGTITMDWIIESGSYPVLVDTAGIIGVLTTGSEGLAQDVAATATTLAATTTWTSDSTELGVLNSRENLAVLVSGEPLTGSTTWSAADSALVERVIAGDSPFSVGLQVRIGTRTPVSGTELLASLTSEIEYAVKDGEVVGPASGE